MHEENKIKLSDVANADRPIVGKGSKTNRPPTPSPVNFRKSLAAHSSEILEEVYEALGGTQGSQMYWRNHEQCFREQIEAKILVKRATADVDVQEAAQTGKSIFQVFINNNGLAKPENSDVVEATLVNPKLEDKHDD